MQRGMQRPPAWALIVIVAGLAAVVVLTVYALERGPAEKGPTPVLEASPPPSPPTTIEVPTEPRMLVLGDSYVQGNGAERADRSFAHVAAGELGWALDVSGSGGSGFLNPGPAGDQRYGQRVPALSPGEPPDVIVVQAGISDRGARGDIGPAAYSLIAALQNRWADAEVVLMGPVNPVPPDPWAAETTRVLRQAAVDAEVPLIDASGWLTEDNIVWLGNDDSEHVNQAGHDYIGRRLAEALQAMAVRPGRGG